MASEFDDLDEATLKLKLEEATDYQLRSQIRKAIRNKKKATGKDVGSGKKTGAATYRRPGFQAPKLLTLPNSVTGNVLPDKVNMDTHTITDKGSTVISYMGLETTKPPRGVVPKSKAKDGVTTSPARQSTYSARQSTSSARQTSVSSSPRGSVSSTKSPEPEPENVKMNGPSQATPEPVREPEPPQEPSPEPPREPTPEPPREPTPEPPREPTPEPPREPTPEPPREATPEPPREPTPEPPREPTPEPPREPTPEPPREPTPEPVREPSPEPVREPTPKPVREPTPEPVREPTPEPVREPSPEPVVERSPTPPLQKESEEEEEEESGEEEEESDEDEEEDEDHEPTDDSRHEYRAVKEVKGEKKIIGVPLEYLVKEEPGVASGDFRTKLRKAENTKVNTKAAFPQAKSRGEQVDFRTVLKRSGGPERKQFRSGGSAQTDFRDSLKRNPKVEVPSLPEKAPKPSRRKTEDESAEQSPPPPPQEEEEVTKEPQAQESVEEDEKEQPEEEQPEEEPEEQPEEEPEEQPEEEPQATEEPDTAPVVTEEDEYEAKRAERLRRREQRRKELEELDKKPERVEAVERKSKSPPAEKTQGDSTYDMDSYEARKEARRKAREERLKQAAARVEQEPRMSYRERKAREQLANAADSRKKWENREEDSGEKTEKPVLKRRDTATQQLLAWCQHKTKYYENVEVKDFRGSWSDGLAFCAILHSFMPDKIPYEDLSADNPRRNFTVAFEAAKDVGIPEMLDVEDMVTVKIPDAKSIMTFLVTIYQHFNS